MLFLALWPQWELAVGLGGAFYTCIPAPRVEAVMNLRGVKRAERWELFRDVQVMESAARRVRNRRG